MREGGSGGNQAASSSSKQEEEQEEREEERSSLRSASRHYTCYVLSRLLACIELTPKKNVCIGVMECSSNPCHIPSSATTSKRCCIRSSAPPSSAPLKSCHQSRCSLSAHLLDLSFWRQPFHPASHVRIYYSPRHRIGRKQLRQGARARISRLNPIPPAARCLTLVQSELVRKLCGAPFLGESSPTLGLDSQVPCMRVHTAARLFLHPAHILSCFHRSALSRSAAAAAPPSACGIHQRQVCSSSTVASSIGARCNSNFACSVVHRSSACAATLNALCRVRFRLHQRQFL